ncbi:glutamine-rich protein 2 [Lynx canadensis]|uniref:glutamine-rich protein 2 n=1 Tax=Lynx canadensis TaxID=61383 RepID=UPI0011B02201|nr:glutamine-rich protein 2 [Lynx canadensis]
MGQLGMMPPGVDEQGSVLPGMDRRGMMPPLEQLSLGWSNQEQLSLVWSNQEQVSLVWCNQEQLSLVWCNLEQVSLVWSNQEQLSLVWSNQEQVSLVWSNQEQVSLVWCNLEQVSLVWSNQEQVSLVWCNQEQLSLVWSNQEQLSLVWCNLEQVSVVWSNQEQLSLVWCNLEQVSLVWSNQEQVSLVWCNQEQLSVVWSNQEQLSLVWSNQEQLSLVWCNLEQVSVVWSNQEQLSLVWCNQEQLSLVWCNQEQLSLVWSNQEQLSLVWCNPEWVSVVWHNLVQLSLGWSNQEHLSLVWSNQEQVNLVQVSLVWCNLEWISVVWSTLVLIRVVWPSLVQVSLIWHNLVQLSLGWSNQEQLSLVWSNQEQLSLVWCNVEWGSVVCFPIAVETFRLMGELIGLYVELKENMKELDEEKAGQTDLEKLHHQEKQVHLAAFQGSFTVGGWDGGPAGDPTLLTIRPPFFVVKKTIPPDLQEQLKTLKALTKEVRQERAKLDKIQRLLEGEREQEIGKEMKDDQLSTQLGILRVTVADIEKELAELRESQEQGKVSMEHSVSEASLYLQDQLDKLRTIIESMLASSSTLLSMSMTPRKILTASAPSQIDPETTCPACSLDLGHQVSLLVQRYEQLQDMVTNLAATRPSKKAKLQSQDEELLGHIQSAILQVQGDCEKLNITTGSLIEDHRQKQKDIDVLYQGLEKLEKEKANREHLEMEIDVKADKSALEAKVSRVQFDATTEQLNHMMQELMSKMSGQERDWQKMLDKLLVEMDSKLDRLELDPVKQLLEDRWKALRQQLKERPPLYQADEAAAMRKQLLAHFHCLSCDRPLETPVTGQIIPVIPMGPGLPGHRSIRPYTVFELEQVRQQSRNLKLGCAPFPRGDLAHTERSVGRLRTMHSKMLMDIEKVQIHFGGSVKASSQMIRELLQAQCLSAPCHRRVPDMADYTYSSAPRRCGGSHTLTYPSRRNRLQHLSQGLYPTEEIQIAMKHDEVDILGLDGHIYKGRIDTRLPGIPSKDTPVSASGMTKHKAKQPRPHTHRQQSLSVSSQLPSRPQSAQMLAGNNSAPSHQRKDRPVSSEGLLSQPNVAHPPSPSEMGNRPPDVDVHLDVPPGEGLEEPTRGPRSTTAH